MGRTVQTILTVEGNTAPPLALTAQRSGVAINLTGCTVDLLIWNGTTQTNTGHTLCTITSAAAGTLTYTRQTGDIPTAGTYLCDLRVTYGDGTIEILYTVLKLKVALKSGSIT